MKTSVTAPGPGPAALLRRRLRGLRGRRRGRRRGLRRRRRCGAAAGEQRGQRGQRRIAGERPIFGPDVDGEWMVHGG